MPMLLHIIIRSSQNLLTSSWRKREKLTHVQYGTFPPLNIFWIQVIEISNQFNYFLDDGGCKCRFCDFLCWLCNLFCLTVHICFISKLKLGIELPFLSCSTAQHLECMFSLCQYHHTLAELFSIKSSYILLAQPEFTGKRKKPKAM